MHARFGGTSPPVASAAFACQLAYGGFPHVRLSVCNLAQMNRGGLMPGASRDPLIQNRANLKRRLASLKQHAAARGDDGKSEIARRGGLIGGPARAAQFGDDPRIWSLEMNRKRWGW